MVSRGIRTVIKDNIEASRHRNNKLLTSLKRMACPCSASWNVIKIENPLDLERQMPTAFYGRKIAFRIRYFRQVDEFTIFEIHYSKGAVARRPALRRFASMKQQLRV